MKSLHYFVTVGLFIGIFFPFLVKASALEVTPIRLSLSQETPTDALTLTNKGDNPVLLQVSIMKWSQQNEEDIYQKTETIVANPPIFSVAPHDSQVIRVGLREGWAPIQQEVSYRIYLQEVDQKLKHSPGVHTLLRLSLPLFLTPEDKIKHLRWEAKKNEQGSLSLRAINQGNTHVQISKLDLYLASTQKRIVNQNVFAYLLPQQTKTWTFNFPNDASHAPLKIIAETDSGKVMADAKVLA